MSFDPLERFITEHRDAFDGHNPPLKVWAEIDRSLQRRPQARVVQLRSRFRAAASVVLLLLAGGLIGSYLTHSTHRQTAAVLEDVAPEYFELEDYFREQIDARVQQVANLAPDAGVLQDLEQLDRVTEELKRELINAPRGTEAAIVERLIDNYQTKVDILERVLQRLQEHGNQKEKTQRHEISI